MNIAIGFVTGRKQFQNTLKTYVNNWLEYGLVVDPNIRLHLFIAYDLKYFNTVVSDYKDIPQDVAHMIDSINFYGSNEVAREIDLWKEKGLVNDMEASLIFGEGYAKKRNIVSYFAIKKGMDKLIFIDDDEYPVAAVKNAFGKCLWMGQSVVGTHLKYNDEANITHGHHCGYISPIPYVNFNETLTEADFRLFIEAVSNDIVSWDNLKELLFENKCVTYANDAIINNAIVKEVEEEKGMKFISGSNICFNLKKTPDLPPFYNPPGARGEDTFMSTALHNLKVLKVPCYTFHDGFLKYKNILFGVIPTSLEAVEGKSVVNQKRFIQAAIGWIRYKPLMIYITQRQEFDSIMEGMNNNLKVSIPRLNAYFNTTEFSKVLKEFQEYRKNVEVHFNEFQETKRVWKILLQQFS